MIVAAALVKNLKGCSFINENTLSEFWIFFSFISFFRG